ncbi:hypothetical protein BLNAU_7039 [Blattamonas nauphoetae]|uniref:Uncharacterized protein n=1 Tax=Blattamonas nauphoetae TaxID=2049346 RepID=A0ABQ9Y2E3_9EUKA|nr:hypothetical protein BLNAU_7039 [Blattamonas nauphoetae]
MGTGLVKTFVSYSSLKDGGAIFVDLVSSTLPPSISPTSMTFGDVTAGTGCSAQKGQAVYCGVASGKETASLKTIRDSFLHPSQSTPPAFSSTERSLFDVSGHGNRELLSMTVGSLVGSILYTFHHKTTQLSLRADVAHDYLLCGNTLLPYTHSLMLDTLLTLNEKLSTKDKTMNVADSVTNNLELLANA